MQEPGSVWYAANDGGSQFSVPAALSGLMGLIAAAKVSRSSITTCHLLLTMCATVRRRFLLPRVNVHSLGSYVDIHKQHTVHTRVVVIMVYGHVCCHRLSFQISIAFSLRYSPRVVRHPGSSNARSLIWCMKSSSCSLHVLHSSARSQTSDCVATVTLSRDTHTQSLLSRTPCVSGTRQAVGVHVAGTTCLEA